VYDRFAYGGGRIGRTRSSETFKFQGERYNADGSPRENLNILTVADWHSQNNRLVNAANHLRNNAAVGAPDIVLMLGDYADFIISESMLIRDVIGAGAAVTRSVVPALMVRGNHDDRGQGAIRPGIFGLDKLYYQTVRGNHVFTVVDSGEDQIDSSPRFGGFNNFSAYMQEQQIWLNSLVIDTDKINIVMVHSMINVPLAATLDDPEAANISGYFPHPHWTHDEFATHPLIRLNFHNWLNNSGIDIVVAGHNHRVFYRPPGRYGTFNTNVSNGVGEIRFNYHAFVTGGNTSLRGGEEDIVATIIRPFSNGFEASQLNLTGNYFTFHGTTDRGQAPRGFTPITEPRAIK
jgi:predicted phosphodiesterase